VPARQADGRHARRGLGGTTGTTPPTATTARRWDWCAGSFCA
jgi:hypothetical protein